LLDRTAEARGGRVGIIHYATPGMRNDAKFIASVGIMVGGNNRERVFTVFEKNTPPHLLPGRRRDGPPYGADLDRS
jgi:hypothetical protein